MKKLNKQSKIIIQVTKIGGQYCSNIIEEFNDDILTENECELKTMVRGMIAKMQKDPWGNDYLYLSPAEYGEGDYEILSLGADGQEGGQDQSTDIANWNVDEVMAAMNEEQ